MQNNILIGDLLRLAVLAVPVACIAWTVTHEEILREPREYCIKCSREKSHIIVRKFFYVFTCEYCLSHYVAGAFIALFNFTILKSDWRGYLAAWLILVWLANIYMSLFALLRTGIKKERVEINYTEDKIKRLPSSQSKGK